MTWNTDKINELLSPKASKLYALIERKVTEVNPHEYPLEFIVERKPYVYIDLVSVAKECEIGKSGLNRLLAKLLDCGAVLSIKHKRTRLFTINN